MKINLVFAIFSIIVAIGLFVLVGMNKIPYAVGLAFLAGSIIPAIQRKDEKKDESDISKDSGKRN